MFLINHYRRFGLWVIMSNGSVFSGVHGFNLFNLCIDGEPTILLIVLEPIKIKLSTKIAGRSVGEARQHLEPTVDILLVGKLYLTEGI